MITEKFQNSFCINFAFTQLITEGNKIHFSSNALFSCSSIVSRIVVVRLKSSWEWKFVKVSWDFFPVSFIKVRSDFQMASIQRWCFRKVRSFRWTRILILWWNFQHGPTKILLKSKSIREITAPEFLNHLPRRRGQWFFFLNVNGMATALSFGFFAVAYVETIANILIFTKQSSTPALAYRRFRANGQHLLIWYQNSLQPGTKSVN